MKRVERDEPAQRAARRSMAVHSSTTASTVSYCSLPSRVTWYGSVGAIEHGGDAP